jgi:hypothetical protein
MKMAYNLANIPNRTSRVDPTAPHVLTLPHLTTIADRTSRVAPNRTSRLLPNRTSRVAPNRTSRLFQRRGAVVALIFSTDLKPFRTDLKSFSTDLESFRFDFAAWTSSTHLHLVAPAALARFGWAVSVDQEEAKTLKPYEVRYES